MRNAEEIAALVKKFLKENPNIKHLMISDFFLLFGLKEIEESKIPDVIDILVSNKLLKFDAELKCWNNAFYEGNIESSGGDSAIDVSYTEDFLALLITDTIVFPRMMVPIDVDSEIYGELAKQLKKRRKDSYIVLINKTEKGTIGILCKYMNSYITPNGKLRFLLSGVSRVELTEDAIPYDECYKINIKKAIETSIQDNQALTNELIGSFDEIVLKAKLGKRTLETIHNVSNDVGCLCDIIVFELGISIEKKYEVLSCLDFEERAKLLFRFIEEYKEILLLVQSVAKDARESVDKRNAEYYIKNEIECLQKTLNQTTGEEPEGGVELYREKLEAKDLPEEARKEAFGELRRMERMSPQSHEYSVISTFLDWIIDLPWNTSSLDKLDISCARKKLDEDHYGLSTPKKRILEYLAIRKLNPKSRSPILCFSGPPGTGKTSLGKSIADAMGRKFQRMSLGGVRDEVIIRGFARTYLGSMPGNIIQALKRAGTNNPIIMLDEIDKLGSGGKGDPSSSLLEALDPEQNASFKDHYINVAFDLSKVIFITTANLLEAIPPALRDRMEIIKFPGYSADEKEQIARDFQIPRQLKEHGLENIKFNKAAILDIITGYTMESGVRNLEREIANVIRGVGTTFVETEKLPKTITKKTVRKYLGKPKIIQNTDLDIKTPGVGIGMYYSSAGGGLFFFESVIMNSKGKSSKLTTSGNLAKVLDESITVAEKWVRANTHICKEITGREVHKINNKDMHMHVPSGATPKDGPSAGVAIIVSIVSVLTNKCPRKRTAFTGEITLRGKVLPVGGIKEKVLGAHRAGIDTIVMPTQCKDDLDKIPKDIKKDITFKFVDTIEESLVYAFPPESENISYNDYYSKKGD